MPILNHAFNAGHSFNHLPFCNYQAFPPSLARSKSTISVFIAAAKTAKNQNCLYDINFPLTKNILLNTTFRFKIVKVQEIESG